MARIVNFLRTLYAHLGAAWERLATRHELSRSQKLWLFLTETVRAISRHQTFTLASALAFKTLLSIVPLLLIGMAVSMTLGTENGVSYADGFLNAIEAKIPSVPALQPLLDLLRDLAKRPREIAGIGFLMLFYTAYSLLSSIDWCINYIWQVEKRRPLVNRLVAYFMVVVIVPVLMSLSVAANSQIAAFVDLVAGQVETVRDSLLNSPATAVAAAVPGRGELATFALGMLSSLITCLALAILIKLMPNTRVRLKAAMWGGLAGGLLIELTRYCFGLYTSHAAANLTRLYGSTMLFIPLTLLWLWVTWAFVLLGAEVAFAAQNCHALALRYKLDQEGLRYRIYIALRLLTRISRDFVKGVQPQPHIEDTADELALPPFVVESVASDLCHHGLLREVAHAEDCYVPGKELAGLTAYDVAMALQRDALDVLPAAEDPVATKIMTAFTRLAAAHEQELGAINFHDLANLPSGRERSQETIPTL